MTNEAYIVDYDPKSQTVSLVFAGSMRRIDDVPLSVGYANPRGGSIRPHPEIGTKCLVAGSYDDPKVIGFLGIYDKRVGSYGRRDPEATYGDLSFGTAADNYIHLRRSGLIEVKASGVCQTLYIPISGLIQEHFREYRGNCPGGEISLRTRSARTEEGGGAGAVLYAVKCRGSTLETEMGVQFKLGAVSDTPALPNERLLEYRSGAQVRAELGVVFGESGYLFQVLDNAESYEKVPGSALREVKGTEAEVVGAVFKQVNGKVETTVSGKIQISGGSDLFMSIARSVKVTSPDIILEGKVRLGGESAIENAIKGASFLTAYLTHTHGGRVPPPTLPGPLSRFLSKLVFIK